MLRNLTTSHDKVEKNVEENFEKANHRPGVWETSKENATFADIAGHEKRQADEFPTPQESLIITDTTPAPTTGGVGDLLHNHSHVSEQGKIE